ncbi:MAG: hypothetical protein ACKVKR_07100 [Pseudomonadales bacterium]|jgi:hypothetical protein
MRKELPCIIAFPLLCAFLLIPIMAFAQRDLGETLLLASSETIQADPELKYFMDILAQDAIRSALCRLTRY